MKDDFLKFEKETLYYSASDLVDKLKAVNVRTTPTKVSKILKDNLGLWQKNSSYTRFNLSVCPSTGDYKQFVEETVIRGRFFTVEKDAILKNSWLLQNL